MHCRALDKILRLQQVLKEAEAAADHTTNVRAVEQESDQVNKV